MLKTSHFTLAICVAGSAAAQTPARPDPADPKSAGTARAYESAFRDYRPYADPDISRWRDVNDEVGKLKGHSGHVPQQTGTAARPGAKPPAQGGHGGHK